MTVRAEQRYSATARDTLDGLFAVLDQPIRVRKARPEEGGREIPLSAFRGAVHFTSFHDLSTGDSVWCDADVFDLWPVNLRTFSDGGDNGEVGILRRIETVTVKQVRGLVRRPMPMMIRAAAMHIEPDYTGWTNQHIYGVTPDRRLVHLVNVPASQVLPVRPDHERLIRLSLGLKLHLRYAWTVEIRSAATGFAITIPTTPIGARRLLALRDVPEGARRRAALKHWVAEYRRRRTREDAEADVDVREHLRGAVEFAWGDYSGVVRPSEYDIERAS